jgi:hypothetical protein
MSEVKTGKFGGVPYRELGDLYEAVWDTIMEFEGRVPTMGVLGVLRLVERELIEDAMP